MSPHRSATVHSTVALVAGIAATDHHRGGPSGRRLLSLSLLALGIVYGDIGTSPLYALRECFYGSHPVPPTPANIFGVLSLIFWSLIIVVTISTTSTCCGSTTAAKGASSR